MSEQKKRTYTPEFKEDAIRLVTEQGYKVTEAARNLGINPSVLTRWKSQLASKRKNYRNSVRKTSG
jgi:transposase